MNAEIEQDRTCVILSENSIEHALIALGAMYINLPYAPISPHYSLVSDDLTKRQPPANKPGIPLYGPPTSRIRRLDPWNHTFGGNHNFGLTLYHGGTLYAGASLAQPIWDSLERLSSESCGHKIPVITGWDVQKQDHRQCLPIGQADIPACWACLLPV